MSARTLVIETATAACSVALFEGETLLAAIDEDVGRGHAERLVPMIADLPGQGRADTILVDIGPGSFTGVRVGIAAARGLALGWKARALGFSSLALAAAAETGAVAVALRGGHGQLFVQRFAGSPLRPVSELASLTPEAAAAAMPEARVIGSGAAALVAARGSGEAIERALSARHALSLPESLRSLAASPLYGRAPDAKPAPGGDEGAMA